MSQSNSSCGFNYQTCELGCHDVCDLLLVSVTKLQAAERTLKGRIRPQMRRISRPLAERVLLQNWTKRMLNTLSREAGLGDDACEIGEADSRKRAADNADAPSEASEAKRMCHPPVQESLPGHERRRLSSLVLVTESFQPVCWSQFSSAASFSVKADQKKKADSGFNNANEFRRQRRRPRRRQLQRRHLIEIVGRES